MITLIKYNRWTGTYLVYHDNGKIISTKKKTYQMQDFMSAAVGRTPNGSYIIVYRKELADD